MKKPTILLFLLLGMSIPIFVTGQDAQLNVQRVLDRHSAFGELTKQDKANWAISSETYSKLSGITNYYLVQTYQGLEVAGTSISIHIDQNGKVRKINNQFVADLASKVTGRRSAGISALEAVNAFCNHMGYTGRSAMQVLKEGSGIERQTLLSEGNVASEPVKVKQSYQLCKDGKVRLAWDIVLHEKGGENWWSVRVDAGDGVVLDQKNWVVNCRWDSGCTGEGEAHALHLNHSPKKNETSYNIKSQSMVAAPMMLGPMYNVYPMPLESPNFGGRSIETDPSDPLASPFGWHDTDGIPGAEETRTIGNNVWAQTDHNGNDGIDGFSPDGGAGLNFDFQANLAAHPYTYDSAAVTNLFYWNNLCHDIMYHYGFDEISGNFQENNYGRGGVGEDYVWADAQDGSGLNNANFGTPPDGNTPRMQMFLWNTQWPVFQVNSPGNIAGGYRVGRTAPSFPQFPFNVTGDLILVDDGAVPTSDGCSPILNDLTGKVAVIDRGDCQFGTKALNAQNAGAIAAVICSNIPGDGAVNMGGGTSGHLVTIPVVMISKADCEKIRVEIPGGVNVTLNSNPNPGTPIRDGDLENGIIVHEYAHGISNRLVGGPANTGCLSNAEQMGEGWSDIYALLLTMEPGDTGPEGRGIGTFALDQAATGPGIRPYRYSTDLSINPQTYGNIALTSYQTSPHYMGTVWTAMLWEMNWALIDAHGFDPNLYTGTGGNNIALQLITEGLKLTPCSPGFVDGRDAILLADTLLYGGAHSCLIWQAFAKRGLGWSADQGSSGSRLDGTEAFDLPPACQGLSQDPEMLIFATPPEAFTCGGDSTFLIYVGMLNGFNEDVALCINNLPAGVNATLSVDTIYGGQGTAELVLSGLDGLPFGDYNITLEGKSPNDTGQFVLIIHAVDLLSPVLIGPADGTSSVFNSFLFEWDPVPASAGYTLEIATDPGFGGIVYSQNNIIGTSLQVGGLPVGIPLYWRIVATNFCQTGPASLVRQIMVESSCGYVYTDPQGPNANYHANQVQTATFCADNPGDVLWIQFTDFDLETPEPAGCFDNLKVYDAADDQSGFLGEFCDHGLVHSPGAGLPVFSTNPQGCLTFVFTADPFVQARGWIADLGCNPFKIAADPASQRNCLGADPVYQVDLYAQAAYSNPITLSVLGLPPGASSSFDANPFASFPSVSNLTIGNTEALSYGVYTLTIVATSVDGSDTAEVELITGLEAPTLLLPLDNDILATANQKLQWDAVAGASSYSVEVSTDPGFGIILEGAVSQPGTSYQTTTLVLNETYYWRVRAENACDGPYSSFSFSTATCGGRFTDSGGPDLVYSSSELITYTFCPDDPGQTLIVDFSAFSIEASFGATINCYDSLEVFDGADVSAPKIGAYCGIGVASSPGGGSVSASAPGGCLTFRFTSDAPASNWDGWDALVYCATCPPDTIMYVDQSASGDNNGSSWGHAYTDLQSALDIAPYCPAVTQIWVADGTYLPTKNAGMSLRNVRFEILHDIEIYGGFAGGENFLTERDITANPTILSGDIGIAGDSSDNAFTVVYIAGVSTAALLDGFIIERGYANSIYYGDQNRGGGLYLFSDHGSNCSPRLRNLELRYNYADDGGGATAIFATSTHIAPEFVNCHFHHNRSTSKEAAILMSNGQGMNPVFINCLWHDNYSGGSSVIALRQYYGGRPTFINSTFAMNQAALGIMSYPGFGADAVFHNCILWFNGIGEPSEIYHSIVQHPGYHGVNNNMYVDPIFRDVTNRDFRLDHCSPALDTGNNVMIAGEIVDLDRNPRLVNALNKASDIVDMGCFEMQESYFMTVYEDADGDGFGNPDAPELFGCVVPGFVVNDEDCFDGDPDLNPDDMCCVFGEDDPYWINQVQAPINGVDQLSGNDNGYGHFMADVLTINPYYPYVYLILHPGGAPGMKHWQVYADWDGDQFFAPSERVIDYCSWGAFGQFFLVPPGFNGTTRLRVIMKPVAAACSPGDIDPNACDGIGGGEVEDYTIEKVLLSQSETQNQLQPQLQLQIVPNPFGDEFLVMLDPDIKRDSEVEIEVVNVQGRTVIQRTEVHAGQPIRVVTDGIPAGTYFLRVKTGDGVFTQTIVKQ